MSIPREQWVEFEIGEVFPADSDLACWVSGVSIIANDLTHVNVALLNASDSGDTAAAADATYYFWLACAQYREAAEFFRHSADLPTVSQFISQLPTEAQRQWGVLCASFTPWPGSFVNTVMRPLRNKLFHYPKPRSPELRQALQKVTEVRSGVRVVGEETIGNVRSVYADEIRARLLSVHLGADDSEVREAMRKTSTLVSSLVAFARECEISYLTKLPSNLLTVEDRTGSGDTTEK